MICDPVDDVAEAGFGIEAIEFCGCDEGVNRRGTFAACIESGEEIVLAAESQGEDGAFGRIVIDLQPPSAVYRVSAVQRESA